MAEDRKDDLPVSHYETFGVIRMWQLGHNGAAVGPRSPEYFWYEPKGFGIWVGVDAPAPHLPEKSDG